MYGYTPNINPALQKFSDDVDEKKKQCINCPGLKVCQKVQQRANCDGRCQVTMVLLLAKMAEDRAPKKGKAPPAAADSLGLGLVM